MSGGRLTLDLQPGCVRAWNRVALDRLLSPRKLFEPVTQPGRPGELEWWPSGSLLVVLAGREPGVPARPAQGPKGGLPAFPLGRRFQRVCGRAFWSQTRLALAEPRAGHSVLLLFGAGVGSRRARW
jgi:hypothetical protein